MRGMHKDGGEICNLFDEGLDAFEHLKTLSVEDISVENIELHLHMTC